MSERKREKVKIAGQINDERKRNIKRRCENFTGERANDFVGMSMSNWNRI